MAAHADLHRIPISQRPKHGSWFNAIAFPLLFNAGLLAINTTQLLLWPLSLVPPLRRPFNDLARQTKASFCQLLILMTVLFGPTELLVSAGEGVDLQQLVRRDMAGRPVGLDLERRAVVMGNHQCYADWVWAWVAAYLADASDGVIILLKKSLKWIPVVGWGMQAFDFIFLARKWKDDRRPLTVQLARIVREALDGAHSLWIVVFPEGTIVSEEERRRSKAYAEKVSIEDTTNVLLPHSLGLYTILSHLAPIPNLPLIDLTIGYPGVPPAGQAQNHYNLVTMWWKGVAPPAIHVHVRVYDPASQLDITPSSAAAAADGPYADANDDADEQRKKAAFGAWLLARWREKDELMGTFYRTGAFVPAAESVAVPVQFVKRGLLVEGAMAFGLFGVLVPGAVLGWLGWKLVDGLSGGSA